MKRSLIAILLTFTLSIQSLFAIDFSEFVSTLGRSASVENLLRSQCGPEFNNLGSLESNYKEICPILRESEACKDVEEEDKIECKDYKEENTIELMSFRALGYCGWGLLNSLYDLLVFLKDAVLGTLGYLTGGETFDKVNGAVSEYASSFMQYGALELDKELDKGHSNARAALNVAGTMIKDLFKALSNSIQEEYVGLGCYKNGPRIERVCKLIGDVTLPPAAAIALIFKLRNVKLARNLAKKDQDTTPPNQTRDGDTQEPDNSPDANRSGNGLSDDDVRDRFSLLRESDKTLNPESKEAIFTWTRSLGPEELNNLKTIGRGLNKDLNSVNDPSSFLHSLRSLDNYPDEQSIVRELLSLTEMRVRAGPAKKRYKDINNWVKSPEHALYLFDRLNADGLDKNWELIRYLSSQNKYFAKALPVRGSPKTFITYAFEKEGKSNNIGLYYRHADYDDEAWMALPHDEQIRLLNKNTPKQKDDVPYTKIAPTAFRPNYLGKYTEEVHGNGNTSFVWEIKSKQYEFDNDRIIEQMRETAHVMNDSQGFHTHVVFEMPNNYKHFDDFGLWTKQVNDYLYLRGMEEALHGGVETNIMRFKAEKAPRRKKSYNENIPETLASLERWSHKGFSMAVRGKIYGPSLAPDSKRVGLELRDISRDVDNFGAMTDQVAKGVADYRWENIKAADVERLDIGFLRPTKEDFNKMLKELTDNPKVAKHLADSEAYGAIPLIPYEKLEYLDYRTGKKVKPSPEQVKRIVEARENYIKEMKVTTTNLENMIKNGETFEPEDLQMTIQMDLTTWAKKAQVSELFEGI